LPGGKLARRAARAGGVDERELRRRRPRAIAVRVADAQEHAEPVLAVRRAATRDQLLVGRDVRVQPARDERVVAQAGDGDGVWLLLGLVAIDPLAGGRHTAAVAEAQPAQPLVGSPPRMHAPPSRLIACATAL